MATTLVENNSQKKYFRISIPNLIGVVVGLPVFASIFCITWSVIFDFTASTATHCKVSNYLPTLSSAIGGYAPQRYVWRGCIALHCAPRFLLAAGYYGFHTSVDVGRHNHIYRWMACLLSSLHICENLALIALTYVSSTENGDFHENAFVVFMVCALVYMLLTCFVFYWGRMSNGRQWSSDEARSLRYKVCLFVINISSFLLAVYLYFRHNSHCEPGGTVIAVPFYEALVTLRRLYTWFAVCEYVTVFSNIAFHATVIWDWRDYTLLLSQNDFVDRLESKYD